MGHGRLQEGRASAAGTDRTVRTAGNANIRHLPQVEDLVDLVGGKDTIPPD
jgi:hypothetical protein